MKTFTLSLLMAAALFFSGTPVHATESECPKLKRFVEVMYDAADFLTNRKEFDENPDLEKKLDELMTILRMIADHEGDAGLNGSVAAMSKIWEMEEWTPGDRNAFRRAFDSTSVALERLYEKQCD